MTEIQKEAFKHTKVEMLKHWDRLPREVEESLHLTPFQTRLDTVLGRSIVDLALIYQGIELDDLQRFLSTSITN